MLKLFQSSTLNCPVVTVSCEPLVCVLAEPDTTLKPCGLAYNFKGVTAAKTSAIQLHFRLLPAQFAFW
jgi:hypothetical protein